MNREKIENVLFEMGVPAGINGFEYIADAIEYMDEHGEHVSVTKELYPAIAKKRNTVATRVERCIRHAFDTVRDDKGDYDLVEKYIGYMNCTNSSSLVMLYKRIKQDCDTERKPDAGNQKPAEVITVDQIRKIAREEITTFWDTVSRS